MKQFETFCKGCGRKIIMTWNGASHRWVPCDPEISRYRRCGSPFTYVDVEGITRHGEKIGRGYYDPDAEFGYQRHRVECADAVRRKTV